MVEKNDTETCGRVAFSELKKTETKDFCYNFEHTTAYGYVMYPIKAIVIQFGFEELDPGAV